MLIKITSKVSVELPVIASASEIIKEEKIEEVEETTETDETAETTVEESSEE